MIYLNVGEYLVWYVFFIITLLVIMGYASMKHTTALPFMWGLIVALVLLLLMRYIEPVLFGFLAYYNIDWVMFALTLGVSVLWFGLVLKVCHNSVVEGVIWR